MEVVFDLCQADDALQVARSTNTCDSGHLYIDAVVYWRLYVLNLLNIAIKVTLNSHPLALAIASFENTIKTVFQASIILFHLTSFGD